MKHENHQPLLSEPQMQEETPNIASFDQEFIDFSSLFAILSAKSIDEENRLRFGVPINQLSEVLSLGEPRIKHILNKFNEEISNLGLQVIWFKDNGETWVTLKHSGFAPLELSRPAEILLGFSFARLLETQNTSYRVEDFRLVLTTRGFLTNAEFTNGLEELVKKRYLKRSRGNISLDIRSQIEFTKDAIVQIGKQAQQLLQGKNIEPK